MKQSIIAVAFLLLACGTSTKAEDVASFDTRESSPFEVDAAPEVVSAPPQLTLPEYPWWDNAGLAVDKDRLAEHAAAWCQTTADNAQWPEFYFGWMPETEVAALCGGETDAAILLGHMYLSGYYGGLWFRDNADLMGGGEGEGHGGGPVTEEDFRFIADNAEQLAAWAATGSDAEVLAHNEEALLGPPGGDFMETMMDSLLVLFGYNYGYVQAILDNPPDGADKSGLGSPCKGYLDCPVGSSGLSMYSSYEEALGKLENPPDETWQKWADEVEKSKQWASIGGGLWSDGSIAPDAWRVLVGINVVYLRVTTISALSALMATADSNVDAGRCSLLLEAATDTWNRAYFMALSSDAAVGTAPQVICPGD